MEKTGEMKEIKKKAQQKAQKMFIHLLFLWEFYCNADCENILFYFKALSPNNRYPTAHLCTLTRATPRVTRCIVYKSNIWDVLTYLCTNMSAEATWLHFNFLFLFLVTKSLIS